MPQNRVQSSILMGKPEYVLAVYETLKVLLIVSLGLKLS